MKYLKEKRTDELIINKSRFISVLIPITSNDEISNQISLLKKEYPKATHYCYAAITGNSGEYHSSSDDSEPSGTAGVPILSVLKHLSVTNILCVVIRYFGGIKLGSGGLIRAYGGAASNSLNNAVFYKIKKLPLYKIVFSYSLVDKFDSLFKQKAVITNKEFLNEVTYNLYFYDLAILEEIKYLLSSCKYLGEIELHIDEL